MAYSFRQDLFEDLSFDISCCHDADELQSIIEFGGGRIDKKRGENTITLLTRNSQSGLFYTPHRDLYCSDFILKCCIKNTILPLKDFLFQKSFFDNNFDPNNVLLGKISWDEAQLFLSPGKRRSIDKRPTDCLKINGQVPVVKMNMLSSSKEAKLKRTARHEFDEEDRQKIIDFIIANQDFNPADPEYWQKMAKGFSSHTWQSLKGHFRNKIYPCIEKYKLSKELEDNIRTRIEGSRRSRSKSLNKQQHQKGTEANGNTGGDDNDRHRAQGGEKVEKSYHSLNNRCIEEQDKIMDEDMEGWESERRKCVTESMQNSIQLHDETTVTDNFAQTDAVDILPLPAGCDVPKTFADAIKLIKSTISIKKQVVEIRNNEVQVPCPVTGEHESEIEEPCPEENETEAQESRPDESKTESEESWSERNEDECQGSHPENGESQVQETCSEGNESLAEEPPPANEDMTEVNESVADVTLQETSAKENTRSAAKKSISVSKLTQNDSTPSSSPVRRSTRRSLAEQPTPKKTRLSLNF